MVADLPGPSSPSCKCDRIANPKTFSQYSQCKHDRDFVLEEVVCRQGWSGHMDLRFRWDSKIRMLCPSKTPRTWTSAGVRACAILTSHGLEAYMSQISRKYHLLNHDDNDDDDAADGDDNDDGDDDDDEDEEEDDDDNVDGDDVDADGDNGDDDDDDDDDDDEEEDDDDYDDDDVVDDDGGNGDCEGGDDHDDEDRQHHQHHHDCQHH